MRPRRQTLGAVLPATLAGAGTVSIVGFCEGEERGDLKKHRAGHYGTGRGRHCLVPLPLWPQSASPTGAKEAEEHEQCRRCTQGVAPPSASLALGWYASRFQRSNAAGTAALPGVESVPNQSKASGVNPHGPIRPHGPIHGIMPHESVSPRPSAPRQLVPTVLGVPWNRQYQWVRHYAPSSFCISDPSAPTAPTAPTDRRCGRAVPAWLFLATFGAYCLFNKHACRLAPRGTRRSSAVNNKE